MKKVLIISVIFIISSCTSKIDLRGDWKATHLVINNEDSVGVPSFPLTYFKSDSLVIYFERLMKYSIHGDSIIFINESNPRDTVLKYKMEIINEDNLIFYYSRKVTDSTNNIINIPYHSFWERKK